MTPLHLGFLFGITVIWGFNFVASKVGVIEFPPLYFAALRFLILFLVVFPWLKPVKGHMGLVIAMSLAGGAVHFALMYVGLAWADDVAPVAIALQLSAPFATALSTVMLGEHVGWRRWGGVMLAFSGVMILGFDPRVFGYWEALSFVVASAFSLGLALVLMRKAPGLSLMQQQAWLAGLSWPILLAMSFWLESGQWAASLNASWAGWGSAFYTALLTSLIGHGGMYWLLQRYEVVKCAPGQLMGPVVGIAFSVWLLDDQLTWRVVVGGMVTMIGVAIVMFRSARKAREIEGAR